jgi:hypothetical protein
MRAGQRQFDPDHPGRATCAEQNNTLAASVNDTFERHQESLSIGILADVLVTPANCTIDSPYNRCGLAETVPNDLYDASFGTSHFGSRRLSLRFLRNPLFHSKSSFPSDLLMAASIASRSFFWVMP